MASKEELQEMCAKVVQEHEVAEQEDRRPNNGLLNAVGFSVLPKYSPIACQAPSLVYYDKTEQNGKYIQHEYPSVLAAGRFGGFIVYDQYEDEDDGKPVSLGKSVFLHLLDTRSEDRGYMLPVETVKIVDIEHELKGDVEFEDLKAMLKEDITDIFAVNRLFSRLARGNKRALMAGYLKSMKMPAEVFETVYMQHTVINERDEDGRVVVSGGRGTSIITILPTDIFTVGEFNIDRLVTEVGIRRKATKAEIMPMSLMIGHTITNLATTLA